MRFALVLIALILGLSGTSAQAGQFPAFEHAENQPLCRGADGYALDFYGRRTFLWRPQWLETIANSADQRSDRITQANAALGRGPYSVSDKSSTVPGASPNDYTSIGPYWWPNPEAEDGLPYIRRDGQVNPERSGPEFDKNRLTQIGADLEALSVGYYLTSDERFAEHAAKLLRVWFIDPKTRMAPHLDFAQGIPGKVSGRAEGIIEASDFSTIIESIGLIEPSPALTADEIATLRKWYADLAKWMVGSEIGKAERRKLNNHGVFYDFYLAHFSLFAGEEEATHSLVANFPQNRLGVQMDREGRFTKELTRTRSWHYSNYVLAGAARLATIGECTGLNLWDAKLDDGRDLRAGHAFLMSYTDNLADWPFPDRDHTAGSFTKMRAAFDRVDVMFKKPGEVSTLPELP